MTSLGVLRFTYRLQVRSAFAHGEPSGVCGTLVLEIPLVAVGSVVTVITMVSAVWTLRSW